MWSELSAAAAHAVPVMRIGRVSDGGGRVKKEDGSSGDWVIHYRWIYLKIGGENAASLPG